jgi:hypothetical protein
MGYHSYNASSLTNLNDRLTGSVYQFMLGLQYRYDLSERNALFAEILRAAFGFPTTSERLVPELFQINIGWRFFL